MSKEKRKQELEREIYRLQKRLDSLEDDDEETEIDFDPFKDKAIRVSSKKGNDDDERRIKAMPPLPPLPPRPPAPVTHSRIVRKSDLSDKERERLAKEKEILQKEKTKILDELGKMKENLHERKQEYSELRRELRERENAIRNKERELRSQRSYSYSWDTDLDQDIEVLTNDLEMRLGDYTRSILASVADSLKSSMGITIKGATDIGKDIKDVGVEIGKIGKEIGDKISKEVYVNIGPTIPDEKLEEFYEIGAAIVAAIGDPNRLRILKELEKGPKYQKELSDITNLRGGTFKHHMDRLLDDDVKFVTQEVVRGRYLLTTRGREALKLAEMQYMRYLEEQKKPKKDTDSDEEFDVKIK